MRKISFLLLLFYALNIIFITKLSASENKELYIIHGFGSNSSSHWFKWLKDELLKEDSSLSVKILDLPDSFNPEPIKWHNAFKEELKNIGENTYFVTHSLGSIALLEYLSSLKEDTKIGGVLLVAGFAKPLKLLPNLDPFVKKDINFKKLQNMIRLRIVLSAKDDDIVPSEFSKDLAQKLGANFVLVDEGKHFGAKEPLKKSPIVLKLSKEELGL